MTEYRLTAKTNESQNRGCDKSYGIALVVDGVTRRVIEDISPDRKEAQALVRLFNEEDLDPVHFSQAVEDFLLDGEL